ncbi:unnamed protein product [[Candida] boidinii]|uniref:Unnamed protein product n=1 Tax=Candida boidinii TaxID=5477 RepID=A0A9W6T2C2_CANBO|nr:hypothetical protein B5S30_g370 [[Candida] boidinii]OWB82809.1 hypothetical protein B5S33_g1437 [[Candida] boidinii]GME74937.1 unnamed protein product [[Candida] boidinii]GMG28492.1 unnamed protein product [[Candida] boidinii]
MKSQRGAKSINNKTTYLFSYRLIKKIINNKKTQQSKKRTADDVYDEEIDNLLSHLPGISVDQDGEVSFSTDCIFFNTPPESQEKKFVDPESIIQEQVLILEIAVTTCTDDTSAINISDDDDDLNSKLSQNKEIINNSSGHHVILTLNSESLPQVIKAQPLNYNQEERIDHDAFIEEITKLARTNYSPTKMVSESTQVSLSA